ncbi:alpha/beta hydrolase family protein [Zoogloea sp.]|uniref:alpha/beta hydrolase family protein n=1 Tax=Zoogloea sp. TaxID=49181 RepID=UPI0035AEAA0F
MDGPLTNPAAVGPWRVATRHADLHDTRRARTLPIKLYLPDTPAPRGLILFSHGLGGSREGARAWLAHWASHGYVLLAMQHPGSDCSILRNNSPHALRSALKTAMNPEALAQRVDDFRFLLERIGRDANLPDAVNAASAIGLAGHSFGAVTVQLMAGERRPHQPPHPRDPRIRAALALSPSARQADTAPGLDHRFGQIHLPFFGITGSRDDGMGLSDITAANRELPYRHMPADGGKYLLVFAGGTHLDFAGEASDTEGALFRIRRQPAAFHPQLLAASTAFWHAHLAGDADARAWLRTDLAAQLRPDDRFERK